MGRGCRGNLWHGSHETERRVAGGTRGPTWMGRAQRRLTVSRADEKGLASRAFTSGVSLGTGVTTLLFLCFIPIL